MTEFRRRIPLADRFWPKVDQSAGLLGCWVWTGSTDAHGYGQINEGGGGRPLKAHRVAFGFTRGLIPAGLELDHLCRNTSCVNPGHLEPVTHAENVRRGDGGRYAREKTACPQGHPYNEANTKLYQGRRYCRRCKVADQRRRRQGAAA